MSQIHEQLSEQFYRWEQRGRGWKVFDQPVEPEPAFSPVCFLEPAPVVDDGRRPTLISAFVQRLGRALAKQPLEQPVPIPEEIEPEPDSLERGPAVELQVSMPRDFKPMDRAFGQFLQSVSPCDEPLAFEVLGLPGRLQLQLAVGQGDLPRIRKQMGAFYPTVSLRESADSLTTAWAESTEESAMVEFGLAREFMLPLAEATVDPLLGVSAALSELRSGELGLFQVIFQPVRYPWAESIVRSVTNDFDKPLFVNAPELTKAAIQKTARPLYAAVVRIATRGADFDRAWAIARDMASALGVFAHPNGNELIPLRNDDYPFEAHGEDVLLRQSRRSGMILTLDELLGFVHLPSLDVPKLAREVAKTKAAPRVLQTGEGFSLGFNSHAGRVAEIRLTPDQRVRHCHIIGASGTGKSTLLFNSIRQDIEAGEGVAVLDPHGDLIDRILGIIPEERIADVVLLDPSDETAFIGFNILSAHSDLEKSLLASDLVSVFQRLSTSWGDQMASVLQNAILAFLESSRGGTLADLRRFLLDTEFRRDFLLTVRDPDIVYYWRKAFPQLSGNKSIGPVLTRLETFLAPKPIRYMVSQPVNRLDFAGIMNNGKILLAKLAQGQLGKENAFLLGSLLVAKFQQTAMSRQAQQVAARRDFWLYMDEFQNFITPSMAEILSGARKYRLGLILAHQELRQLERDREVQSAVLSNCFTRVVFRVGTEDARKLSEGLSTFDARDLQNLETGQAICRVERSDFDFNLTVPNPAQGNHSDADSWGRRVASASRDCYATPRSEVEAMLRAAAEEEPASAKPPFRSPSPPAAELLPSEPTPPPPPPVQGGVPKPRSKAQPEKKAPPIAELQGEPKAAETAEARPPAPADTATEPVEQADAQAHLAIKERIRKHAESLDYTVTDEEHVLDGKGRVDVVLRRGSRVVAREVCVSNNVKYEVGNVLKCLQAGFAEVVVVCPNRSKLARIQKAVAEAITPAQKDLVTCRLPEGFMTSLLDWAAADPEGAVAESGKPRKQKITLGSSTLNDSERTQREKEMLERMAAAMRRNASSPT